MKRRKIWPFILFPLVIIGMIITWNTFDSPTEETGWGKVLAIGIFVLLIVLFIAYEMKLHLKIKGGNSFTLPKWTPASSTIVNIAYIIGILILCFIGYRWVQGRIDSVNQHNAQSTVGTPCVDDTNMRDPRIADLQFGDTVMFAAHTPYRFERHGQRTYYTPISDSVCTFYFKMEQGAKESWSVEVRRIGTAIKAKIVDGTPSEYYGPCLVSTKQDTKVFVR